MLKDFSWDMTRYISKHPVNPSEDGIIPYVAERIFQLEPERFVDIKLSCRGEMLQKLKEYDPSKGAEYATYIFPFIRDAMLRFRMGEEQWSVSSLTNYKMLRTMAWLYHNTKDAVGEFVKKYDCELALAEEYLKVVRGIRNQQPFFITEQDEDSEETGEDVTRDNSWNYADILWNGIQAGKVQKAFDKLTVFLVGEGALHAVRLNQKSKTKRKKKIATAIYEYQADCDDEWGEISVDFENGTAEILRLADWDTMKTNRFANRAIAYLLNCENEKLPKEMIVAFEQ